MSKRPPKPLKPASLRSNTLHRSSENTNLNGEKQSSLLRVPNFQLRNAVSNPEISIVSPGQVSIGHDIIYYEIS